MLQFGHFKKNMVNPMHQNQSGLFPGRYTSLALPDFRYLPGKPFRELSAREVWLRKMDQVAEHFMATVKMADVWKNPLFLYGVDLYNQGYWWETHVVLEKLWHGFDRGSGPALFLKGLIQLAAAIIKLEQKRYPVAVRLKTSGCQKLKMAKRAKNKISGDILQTDIHLEFECFFSGRETLSLTKRLEFYHFPFWVLQKTETAC